MAMHLPSRASRGRRTPMAEINVTPLVDVMLVLLIIFMVTAPLLTAGVPIDLPESRAKALDQDQQPVQVAIDPAGRVFVDRDEVSPGDLPGRLADLRQRSADPRQPPQVFLRADRGIAYGQVARVMGELNRAGLNRVALVTTPGEGP